MTIEIWDINQVPEQYYNYMYNQHLPFEMENTIYFLINKLTVKQNECNQPSS